MCHLLPTPRGSSVVRPSQFQEPISQANVPLLSSSGSINHGNNTQRGTTNLNSSDSRRNSNSNRNSTSGRNATTNPSNSVNCIKTQTHKRELIPVVVNNSIEIQALCDPCADITIIQQSCIPADAVIHPWTDGQFQVVDHKINPISWISLNLSVGKIVHTMPKVGICTHLPFPLILGFDWQQQVQARCTYDSNGALCISTPSLRLYECIHASKPSINCIASNEVSLPPLQNVVLPDLNTKILPFQAQLIQNLPNYLQFNKLNSMQTKSQQKDNPTIISNYIIDNNTLGRVKEKSKSFAVVIPKAMREQTLIACHDDVGHMNAKKTLHNLKQRYWWPNMRKDCKNYVRSWHKCQVVNRRTANAYGLLQQLPIPTTPWEIVSADHMICLPQTRAGNTNMLVHIDHATRYVVTTSSASLGAHSVTDALYHNIILRYGPPSIYISDRGTAFTARHTQHFLQKYGITQSMTPPYSPQANSIVERANGIIVSTFD
ncbi:hypothetical protein TNCV_2498431 [Trichonephila clavipes]|nr:hypothetical protein TNCV_2498431 [Trichonephila clavipes]